jgi:hypothetical protein
MDVDEALSAYLETYEADEVFNNYFSAIRKAFIAGYKAAGGKIPKEQPIVRLVKCDKSKK